MAFPGRFSESQCQVQLFSAALPGGKHPLPLWITDSFCQGILTFVVHSLTVQSNDDVTNRWEKSMGPTAMWQLIPVTGPWWPSKTSPMPALLQREHVQHVSDLCKAMVNLIKQCSSVLEQPHMTKNETIFTAILRGRHRWLRNLKNLVRKFLSFIYFQWPYRFYYFGGSCFSETNALESQEFSYLWRNKLLRYSGPIWVSSKEFLGYKIQLFFEGIVVYSSKEMS